MKLYPSLICLFALFIISCSAKNNTSPNATDTISQPNEVVNDSTIYVFGTPIHTDERMAIKELSAAGIIKCDTIREKDGQFIGAVIEFASVKFGLNRGFVFITSKHDKETIHALVSEISKYYGPPEIDGDEEYPESCIYHWNLYKEKPDDPYIRIRPVRSEDGGLTMMWQF